MLKKLFIVSSILLGLVLLTWLVYVFFLRTSQESPPQPTLPPEQETPPTEQAEVSIRQIANIPFLSNLTLGNDERLYGYHSETAALYALNLVSNKKDVILDTELSGPIVALWANSTHQSILKTRPQQGVQYFLINTQDETNTPITGDIAYLEWDSLGEKIVYINREDAENLRFYSAEASGDNAKFITSVPERSRIDMASVPNSPNMAYWPQSSNQRISPLNILNLSTKSVSEVFVGKYGADYLFSPDGEFILMSWSPERGGSKLILSVINKYGGGYTDLQLPTLTSKCAWGEDSLSVYCAVPTSIPTNAIMPDDYVNGTINTVDVFWKIDVSTGKKKRLVELDQIQQSFDATNLLVVPGGQTLYFLDRTSKGLYVIER